MAKTKSHVSWLTRENCLLFHARKSKWLLKRSFWEMLTKIQKLKRRPFLKAPLFIAFCLLTRGLVTVGKFMSRLVGSIFTTVLVKGWCYFTGCIVLFKPVFFYLNIFHEHQGKFKLLNPQGANIYIYLGKMLCPGATTWLYQSPVRWVVFEHLPSLLKVGGPDILPDYWACVVL